MSRSSWKPWRWVTHWRSLQTKSRKCMARDPAREVGCGTEVQGGSGRRGGRPWRPGGGGATLATGRGAGETPAFPGRVRTAEPSHVAGLGSGPAGPYAPHFWSLALLRAGSSGFEGEDDDDEVDEVDADDEVGEDDDEDDDE